ncbi:MAG TPA: hypothetical protein VIK86_02125 [Candidatus Paceibacterota bacterium]
MIAMLICLLLGIGFIYFLFKVVLPWKQNLKKDAYKQALREYDEEKRKKGEN